MSFMILSMQSFFGPSHGAKASGMKTAKKDGVQLQSLPIFCNEAS